MSKPQATRCSQKQLAYLAYWQSRGYRVKRNERAPESTQTPPSFATRHPVLDALIGSLTLAAILGGLVLVWIAEGAGLY